MKKKGKEVSQKTITTNELAAMMMDGFDRVSLKFQVVEKRFDDIDNKFNKMDGRFDDVEKRLDRIEFQHARRIDLLEDKVLQISRIIEKQFKVKLQ